MNRPLSSHLLVGLQFASIAVALVPWDGRPQGDAAWLLLSAPGLAIGLYTLWHNRPGNFAVHPEPRSDARLVTSGPYRWVRHPMYLSVLLFVAGIALWNGTPWNLLALPALLAALLGKMQREERLLLRRFPDYAEYCRDRKRLIPFVY